MEEMVPEIAGICGWGSAAATGALGAAQAVARSKTLSPIMRPRYRRALLHEVSNLDVACVDIQTR
jgi:hypothetical protein